MRMENMSISTINILRDLCVEKTKLLGARETIPKIFFS